MQYNLITILGPTAVGKTFLGASLADHFGGEIISADSRQVYKRMDIGTGKDLDDYLINGKTVPYHLIDICEPKDEYNLYLFNRRFYKTFKDITSRKMIPFMVGGTGLYLHSVLKSYDLNAVDFENERFDELNNFTIEELKEMLKAKNPALHNTTDLMIKERIIKALMISEKGTSKETEEITGVNSLNIGINLERDEIRKRITGRLKLRLQGGMTEEVEKLLEEGVTPQRLEAFGLEYKFIGKYLAGELNRNDMFQKLNSAIHGFAKRQMTWFRKMEKEGIKINWINGPDYDAAKEIVSKNYFS